MISYFLRIASLWTSTIKIPKIKVSFTGSFQQINIFLDVNYGQWNGDDDLKTREVTFIVPVSNPMGKAIPLFLGL